MKERVLVAWSSGKDSAMALYGLLSANGCEVSALLSVVTECYGRISMHGVRQVLLDQQAEALGIPLEKIHLTQNASNEEYETKMESKLVEYKNSGVSSVVFGDIFLEDLRGYREKNLSRIGMRGIFPLWKMDTARLAHTFIDAGFKAVISCVDSNALDQSFVGREFDRKFLSELPSGVDPCGEAGEFHSFVYEGPIFRKRISFEKGDIVLRDNRFYYCDLIEARSIDS